MFQDEKGVKAGRAWFNRMKSGPSGFEYLRKFESPDEDKMRGFYVDLERSSGQPQGVNRYEAQMHFHSLEGALTILHPLRRCLEDEACWSELVDEIERLRDEYVRTS